MCAPETSIATAIQRGFFQQVRFLLEFGHNVNERDPEKRTPLMSCALIEEEIWGVGLARLFIEKGADMGLRDRRGLTCLHYACIYERGDLVRVLLTVADFDINQSDKLGNTPLHYAVSHGQADICRGLLDALHKYGQKVDVPNKRGLTPIMAAWRAGRPQSARLVRAAVGDALDTEARDKVEGWTVADWEAEYWARQAGEESRDTENRRPRTAVQRGGLHLRPSSVAVNKGSRPLSAFSTDSGSRRSPSSIDKPLLRRGKENSNNCKKSEVVDGFVDKNAIGVRLIHSASTSDLRNKPEFVFNVTPTDCFVPESRFQPALSGPHSGAAAAPTAPYNSWKQDVRRFYDDFGFQFSGSYRKTAKPTQHGQCGTDGRYSPNPSEYPESGIGLNAVANARKFAMRKLSAKSTTSEEDKRKRKNSALVGRQGRRGSLLNSSPQALLLNTQQTAMDTSSTESINAGQKPIKKRNTSSPDAKDDMSDTSSNDRRAERASGRIGSGRSRRGTDLPPAAAPEPVHGRLNKGAGHIMVPMVREPTIKE